MTVKKDEQNQAARLQELFNEVTQHEEERERLKEEISQEDDELDKLEEGIDETGAEDHIRIDVLNLPPRSDVHKPSRRSVRISIGRPFLRLAFVILVLVLIVGVIYFYDDMTDILSLLKQA